MKILPVSKIKLGMRLGQNIYRHDGLLALPKGAILMQKELDTLKHFTLDFVLVSESENLLNITDDISFTMNILESAFRQSTFWDKNYGIELYEGLENRIIKNKKLRTYINSLREFDSYSYAHCINISMVVAAILSNTKKVDDELIDIVLLTLFHDIGRIKMENIFNKEGRLDEKEYRELTTHPMVSYKMLRKVGYSEYELKFVLETHERWNGTGYPERLKAEDISDLAQIVFISDVYNALSSYRPYRGSYTPYDVLQIMESERDKAFGSKYIDIFLERFKPYPIGSLVELNNGDLAYVRKIRPTQKLLPIVEIISKDTGEKIGMLDLSLKKDIRIRKIVQAY